MSNEARLRIRMPVTDAMTAQSMGSGDMPVLATPALTAAVERACMQLARQYLESGQTTVGVYIQTTHEAAMPVGDNLQVEARLLEREGRRLTFEAIAYDGSDRVVGRAKHDRVVVDRDRFLSSVMKRLKHHVTHE